MDDLLAERKKVLHGTHASLLCLLPAAAQLQCGRNSARSSLFGVKQSANKRRMLPPKSPSSVDSELESSEELQNFSVFKAW